MGGGTRRAPNAAGHPLGWGWGSHKVDPMPDQRWGPRTEEPEKALAQLCEPVPHKGPLCPVEESAGGRRGTGQAGGAKEGGAPGPRQQELGRWAAVRRRARNAPAAEKLPVRPGGTGQRGRPTFGRCCQWPGNCLLSLAGAGSPAAPGMQQTEREPLGWGAGRGGQRVSALGSAAAAQLHPAQLSGAAHSISMKRPDADGHSGSSRE